MRFLVVDDESLSLRNLKRILNRMYPDSEVMTYNDPMNALEAGDTDFNVAFLDIDMPGMTGIELAKAFRKKNSGLNIIFVTAHDVYTQDADRLDIDGIVMKPYDFEDIQQGINDLQHKTSAAQEKIPSRRSFFGFCRSR